MIIHQTLHGYSQGHNRLASSLLLSLQDDDRMKLLSDWSEYSGNQDSSYITTYPLLDGRHYVIAKSWYADDMERPGCVWTHSLILDLSSLDEKFDFRSLKALFKRPVKGDYSSYSDVIRYSSMSVTPTDDVYVYQEDVLIWLYFNLINRHFPMLYRVEQESSYYQGLILYLLQYIPFGFLNNVVMCSGSAYGRKSSIVEYNLQFAISAGSSLMGIVMESKPEIDNVCDGIKSICRTMTRSESDTNEALRLFSKDIGEEPLKLCAIGLLLKYLDDAIAQSGNIPFSKVVKLLVDVFPSKFEGEHVKMTFCKKSVSNLFSSELIVLIDLATLVPDGLMNFELVEYHQRVVALCNEEGIDEFAKYLSSLLEADYMNSVGEYQLKHSPEYLSAEDYSYLAQNYWSVYMSLVMANPNVLKHSFWLDLPDTRFVSAYEVFRRYCFEDFDAWRKLFQIVLYRNLTIDKELMDCFVRNVPNVLFELMDYLNNSVSYQFDPLFEQYCTFKIQDVLLWLKNQKELTMPVASFLVNNILPTDKIVYESGSDVWETLYSCNRYENLSYFTFLFILGHNWSDTNGVKFIKRSFYQLHRALEVDLYPTSLWERLEPYTAKLRFINEWDKCKKLRKGIVKYLKTSGYKKSILSDITPDKDLNEILEDIWNKV